MPAPKTSLKKGENPKKGKKRNEGPKSHKELLEELSGLEVRLNQKDKPAKEEETSEKSEFHGVHDLDFNGIDFNSELRSVLSFHGADLGREIPAPGNELEGAISSAPRFSSATSTSPESRGLDYSKKTYDADPYKAKSSEYESKTPDYAAGPAGAEGRGGESPGTGRGFETRMGSGSNNSDGEGQQ